MRAHVSTLVFVSLVASLGCADGTVEGGLCTLERDPADIYCRADVSRQGSLEAGERTGDAARSDVIVLRNSITDTLNPNGRDTGFRIDVYSPSPPGITFYETEASGSLSTDGAPVRLSNCDGGANMTILDSTSIVPDAVARYEEMFGPLVLDETTRTVYRQRAPCFSSTGEQQTYWGIQRWNEADGFEVFFFRYDPEGVFLDVVGPCADLDGPTRCEP